jgi:cation diffusion facilitator CzcD-associated flavoprotein CzcO
MSAASALARKHLERQVADPGLRARLTPDYTIGYKRILLPSDYYPALQRQNVALVTEPTSEIVPADIVRASSPYREGI